VSGPDAKRAARRLARWFEADHRDLPWRRDPAPWRVLVAETMLQQTRIATVVPRFEALLSRFPDPAAMAAADGDEVLALWSGLGYYRRARNLHAAARAIAERHGGRVPDDRAALLDLPGVGAYTAGAVLSIAFGRAEPIVDGNVERVLSRLFLVRGNPKRGAAKKRLWALAEEFVRAAPPAAVNQGMMELGALVCLPRAPRCGGCPLAGGCLAKREGVPDELPERPAPRATKEVVLALGIIREGGRVLLARAPEGGFLAGTWAPPFAEAPDGADPPDRLARTAAHAHGLELRVGRLLGTLRHTITHHRIEARCYAATLARGPEVGEARFVDETELSRYGLSALAARSLAFQFR